MADTLRDSRWASVRRDATGAVHLLGRLPSFLRHPIGVPEARAILARRLARRDSDFLALAKRAVYGQPANPYRQLLARVRCEYGDLERLVHVDGLEEALRHLCAEGVYLSVDELRGRRPVVRGHLTIEVTPDLLRNPNAMSHLPSRTSGSSGALLPVMIDLAYLGERAVDTCLTLEARGGRGWAHAGWTLPSAGGVISALVYAGFGARPVRWFSQVPPSTPGVDGRYRRGALLVRLASIAALRPLPRPVYTSLENPIPIARWMHEVLRAGHTPHLLTPSSSAVRLCQAAVDAGIPLRGAQFSIGGEPVTQARLEVVHRVGAAATPGYGATEVGSIGDGCLAPGAPDDIHLFDDLVAMIQPPDDSAPALPRRALLVSSLRATAPLVLLNVSLGDEATLVRRTCGCPLEALGWRTHLHTIRSYEKLTTGGSMLLDVDVVRVLEHVLSERFGGAPTDYQLIEDETSNGHSRLRLVVHPSLGPLDDRQVVDTFLAAIGAASTRMVADAWRDADRLRVERRVPVATDSGKILHLLRRRESVAPVLHAETRRA